MNASCLGILQRASSSSSRRLRSVSTGGPKPRGKKPGVKRSTPGGNGTCNSGVERTWCTTTTTTTTAGRTTPPLEMGRYGLKRLDYTNATPRVWTAPPHPPTKTVAERVVFPLTLAIASGIVVWVYLTPEDDDMTEYWKRVESGRILYEEDDDDDCGDDDDDYDDDDDE